MLVSAMEVSGVEGNFRSTCERAMGVLRHNKHSVMAMLEAFVYDPLINWRLLAQDANDESSRSAARAPSRARARLRPRPAAAAGRRRRDRSPRRRPGSPRR